MYRIVETSKDTKMSCHEKAADIQKENRDIPWFSSVDDYYFIDNYKKDKSRKECSNRNQSQKEYINDDIEMLFSAVSYLKAKYRNQ